jgi:hypothetical protein
MKTNFVKPAMRGTCPTYTLAELERLPSGTPVVCYGHQENFHITHGGRVIQSRGTFLKLGVSKLDGIRYAFWLTSDGCKKLPATAASHQLGFDK